MATQSIVGTLDKHFDKPLVKLSPELREIADAYIPKWSELSAIERKTKAQEADRQRDVKNGLRIGQITRGNEKVPQRVCLPDSRAMYRKVIFWLAPNETRIPADQIPGAIAETLNPPPERNELAGHALNDLKVGERLKEEREQAKQLRIKFPHLKDGDTFLIGDLNDYLARQEMVAEIRHRREAIDHLDPASRWARRQFEDGFNAVREPVVQARRGPLELSAERCAELANLRELFLDNWIELVGWGIGRHESYDVGDGGIMFINWQEDVIAAAPVDCQFEMARDNRTAPHLRFPCTPAELVDFVDTAIGIHSFIVPEAFRFAVATGAQVEQGKPITIDAANNAEPPEIRKRAALIAEVIGFWPSIELDLSDSSRNDLRKCAKHDKHGFWFVEPALRWATQRGKIVKTKARSFLAENDVSRLSPMLRNLLNLN